MQDISTAGNDLEPWTQTKRNDPRPLEGNIIEGFYSLSHEHKTIAGLVMARFFLDNTELYRAWGWNHEAHCSFHTVLTDNTLQTSPGCPPVSVDAEAEVIKIASNPEITIPITLIP